MCFQVYFKPSHRFIEREFESSAKTKASTSQLILRHHSEQLSIFGEESMSTKQKDFVFGIILTHLFMTKGEESTSRALMIPFLAIHAKGGRKYEPKAKGPHHHQFQKLIFSKNIFNWYLIVFKRGRK
jgi:hypothetical protein